jgi:hypothetical protein
MCGLIARIPDALNLNSELAGRSVSVVCFEKEWTLAGEKEEGEDAKGSTEFDLGYGSGMGGLQIKESRY